MAKTEPWNNILIKNDTETVDNLPTADDFRRLQLVNDTNTTLINSGPIFDAYEQALADIYIYPLCILLIFIFVGVISNGFVLYIFSKQWERNKTSVFIITLAVLDIANCTVNMPVEVSVFAKPLTFDHELFCKCARCFSYINTAAYSFVLVAVAYDRYLMVCQPLKRLTYGTRYARRACIGASVLAIVTQWPSFFLYGTFTFRIPVQSPGTTIKENVYVEGKTCLIKNEYYYENPLPTYLFQGFLFIGHVIIFVTLTVVYIIIGRRLYMESYVDTMDGENHGGHLKKSIMSAITGRTKNSRPTRVEDIQLEEFRTFPKRSPKTPHRAIGHPRDEGDSPQEIKPSSLTRSLYDLRELKVKGNGVLNDISNKIACQQNCDSTSNNVFKPANENGANDDPVSTHSKPNYNRSVSMDLSQLHSTRLNSHSKAGKDLKELSLKRNTRIMRMVTFTFILSYLPFLILVTLRYSNKDIPTKLSKQDKIVYHVFLKSYFFNSVIRPFIYIVMNKQYRSKLCLILKRFIGRHDV
ncbi:GALR3-like protein [Mya arenaria]|uniref:GALR3-like protein n=1 Tax=Mya arenaria TaxID=6604 RepID=A0ABY7F8S5_MYAAR|nr:uncharacterized protein LOC128206280 [Mya arenaria]WAR17179.1 GALR3-like protein [Mya arenaria]